MGDGLRKVRGSQALSPQSVAESLAVAYRSLRAGVLVNVGARNRLRPWPVLRDFPSFQSPSRTVSVERGGFRAENAALRQLGEIAMY